MTDVFVLCLAAFSFFLYSRATADSTFRKGTQLGQKRCLCVRQMLDEFPVEHITHLPSQRRSSPRTRANQVGGQRAINEIIDFRQINSLGANVNQDSTEFARVQFVESSLPAVEEYIMR